MQYNVILGIINDWWHDFFLLENHLLEPDVSYTKIVVYIWFKNIKKYIKDINNTTEAGNPINVLSFQNLWNVINYWKKNLFNLCIKNLDVHLKINIVE